MAVVLRMSSKAVPSAACEAMSLPSRIVTGAVATPLVPVSVQVPVPDLVIVAKFARLLVSWVAVVEVPFRVSELVPAPPSIVPTTVPSIAVALDVSVIESSPASVEIPPATLPLITSVELSVP